MAAEGDAPLYFACLRLSGRRCVVAGGGTDALEKVEDLLACSGDVTVIAPEVVPEIEELAAEGSVRWERRGYETGDLAGTLIVAAVTGDAETDARIAEDAEACSTLADVMGAPAECTLTVPPAVRTGPLAIAISTSGATPALARRIGEEISEQFGEPYARLALLLNEVRGWAKGTLPTYGDRKAFFEGIVNGDPDPIELLRRGDERAVRDLIAAAQRSATPA